MATVQIRNVPDDVYETIRSRAAAVGQSLQEYLLAELSRAARLRTPAEVVAEVEQRLGAGSRRGFTSVSSADAVRAQRESR